MGKRDSGEEPYALSLISWDRLNGRRDEGLAFLECIRVAAGFHKTHAEGGWNPSPSNIPLGEGGIADSAIRVNRVSGPFGHLDVGSSFRDWAKLVCDRSVTGAIPRRAQATVVVPLVDASGAVVGLAPFYMGKTGGLNAQPVTPRHHGVPRRGWVAPGKRLDAAIEKHSKSEAVRTLLRRFTATTYDGAFLLVALAKVGVHASVTLAQQTVDTYWERLSRYDQPAGDVAMTTRSQHFSPYSRGQRVFSRLAGDDQDDIWWPATINMVRRDGTHSITYDETDQNSIDANRTCKPESELRPDICVPAAESAGCGDVRSAEDDDVPSRAEVSAQICAAALTGAEFIDVLGGVGESNRDDLWPRRPFWHE